MIVLPRIACLLAVFAPVTALAQTASLPIVQLFAPGVVSGPANDGSPTFSPDGKTLFLRATRRTGA
jgi:WD40-like Beta Propeller Repeat